MLGSQTAAHDLKKTSKNTVILPIFVERGDSLRYKALDWVMVIQSNLQVLPGSEC